MSPSSDLLYEWKKNKDIIKYIKRYKSEVLDKLSINEVISDLLTLTNNKKGLKYAPNFILVCYEPIPPKDMSYKEIINSEKYFCHRHLVAKWFNLSGIDKFQYVEVKEF